MLLFLLWVTAWGVTHLTNKNFDEFIAAHPTTCVLFYAKWCHWSQELLPVFTTVAQMQNIVDVESNTPVEFALYDESNGHDILGAQNIVSFPTIRLHIDQKVLTYDGIRIGTAILKWILDHVEGALKISSTTDMMRFHASHANRDLAFIYITSPQQELADQERHAVRVVSRGVEHIHFAELVPDQSVLQSFIPLYDVNVQMENDTFKAFLYRPTNLLDYRTEFNSHVLVASEHNVIEFRDDLTNPDQISTFIRINHFPSVSQLFLVAPKLLFMDGRPLLLISVPFMMDPEDKQRWYTHLQEISESYVPQLLTIFSQNHDVMEVKLAGMLGIDDSNQVQARIFQMRTTSPEAFQLHAKYRPSEDLTTDTLEAFITSYLSGSLAPWLKSEEEPDEEDEKGEKIITLVGTSYDRIIQASKNDVLVVFHAPWCGHCKKLEPALKQVAEYGAESGVFTVARIDGTANEIKDITIRAFPTLYFYQNNGNPKTMIPYQGDLTAAAILEFVQTNASRKFNRRRLDERVSRQTQRVYEEL